MNEAFLANLGRNYLIQIETPRMVTCTAQIPPKVVGDRIEIAPPVSATIDVRRDVSSTLNHARVSLVNLGEDTRNKIYKDKFDLKELWRIVIAGGYGDDLKIVFIGNIQEAYSYHDGTEWYTVIESYDGMHAVQNATINQSFSSETPKEEIVRQMIANMDGLKFGALGEAAQGESPRGRVEVGDTQDKLMELVANNMFIDGEIINILKSDEVLEGEAFIIDAELLRETPRRRDTFLDVEANFSPGVRVGTVCEIRGMDTRFDGQYMVMGLEHHLEVSSADAGDAYTSISLYSGARSFSRVSGASLFSGGY